MNELVKDRWIARLESGEVDQLVGHLGDVEGKRCCLGVLCDLAVEDGIIDAPTVDASCNLLYDGYDAILPLKVMKWSGVEHANGAYNRNVPGLKDALSNDSAEFKDALSHDNDCGETFKDIAQTIRKKF